VRCFSSRARSAPPALAAPPLRLVVATSQLSQSRRWSSFRRAVSASGPGEPACGRAHFFRRGGHSDRPRSAGERGECALSCAATAGRRAPRKASGRSSSGPSSRSTRCRLRGAGGADAALGSELGGRREGLDRAQQVSLSSSASCDILGASPRLDESFGGACLDSLLLMRDVLCLNVQDGVIHGRHQHHKATGKPGEALHARIGAGGGFQHRARVRASCASRGICS